MTWKKIEQDRTPVLSLSKCQAPAVVVGTFTGSREINIPGRSPAVVHEIKAMTLNGQPAMISGQPAGGVWGFGQLNYVLRNPVLLGKKVQITYMGKQQIQTKRGPVMAHQVEVLYSAERDEEPPVHKDTEPILPDGTTKEAYSAEVEETLNQMDQDDPNRVPF